ncbi:MAG: hypothetical protein ACUVRS_03375 [Armatimonadota bacterium]
MNEPLLAIIMLLSIMLVVVAVGIIVYVRRLTQAFREISDTCVDIRRQILLVTADARSVLEHASEVLRSAKNTVDTTGRIADLVERLVDGRTISDAADKVISHSRSTLSLITEGVKAAVRAFKTARQTGNTTSEVAQPRTRCEQKKPEANIQEVTANEQGS